MHWLKSDVKLVSIQEVDELYRSNPFILTGYRDKTTFFGCLKSVLLLHNETINIWSHLLGFAFFVGIFLRDILFLIPSKESGVEVTQTDFFCPVYFDNLLSGLHDFKLSLPHIHLSFSTMV